jgi:ABC-type glycerol-3-phosphate transport system substrate-binding protein
MSGPRPGPTRKHARRRARFAARIMIVGTVLTLLSGCAGWGFSGSGGGKTVTLTYALWDPHEQVGYQQSINEFEKLHPDIKVDIENIRTATTSRR